MTSKADSIAQVVLQQFNKLPSKRKPKVRNNGIHEWVPLSGIVSEKNGTLTCLALATGMKCLPASKLEESNGVGIHDWHAEILAIRTFNRFLLDECRKVQGGAESDVLIRNNDASITPFRIQDDVKLHMYCSEAPCGDASMELTMAAQDDDSPWDVPSQDVPNGDHDNEVSLPGRAYFSQLGIVRRKPARGDAPPTLSKSCSDKIALKQCTSLLSSLTSLFISPFNAYIHTLVLPVSQYSVKACWRAFSAEGRMRPIAGMEWPGQYAFKAFTTCSTDIEFQFSKRVVSERSEVIAASNIAAAWSRSGFEETILGGVVQGRKAFEERGASWMSKRCMWACAALLANELKEDYPKLLGLLGTGMYKDVKEGKLLDQRRTVKEDVRRTALAGWLRNDAGSNFTIRGQEVTEP